MARSRHAQAMRRHRPRRRFQPGDNRPDPQRKPKQTATAVCPRCDTGSTTRYRYCFMICRCGWWLRIEPMPRYGNTNPEHWPITVDEVRQVAPDGWEDAAKWPAMGAASRRQCQRCRAITVQTPRTSGHLVVTTCVDCDYAHPDQEESRTAVRDCMESWYRRDLVKVVYGDDGSPCGVRMPSHEDVIAEEDLKALQQTQQDLQ